MTIKKILPFTLLMAMTALTQQVQAASEDAPTQGAYVTDEQRFYVEGQSVTEVIETANSLVCYISNMRPDALISDGAYQAKVYEERCVTTGADATAEQASASATSSQSSTTASSGSGAAEIDTETALISTVVVEPIALNPEDPFKPQPMRAIGWVDDKAASADEFDTRIYLEADITAGQSANSPNGEFEMRWSIHSQGVPDWFADLFAQADEEGDEAESLPDFGSLNLGQGLLQVSGSELKFKEYGYDFEGNVALDYLDSDNDGTLDDVSGVYGQPVSFCLDCSEENFQQPDFQPTFRSFASFYQFNISKEKKQVCTSLGEVYENCYDPNQNTTCAAAFEERDLANADNPDYNAFEMIKVPVDRAEFEALAEQNPWEPVQLEETCYSTKSSDAQRNVFRYGVYDADGDRAKTALGNARNAFPMFADVERTVDDPDNEGETLTVEERIFGYADYWGVFIDPRGQRLVETDTQFTPEVFGDQEASQTAEFFTVAETEVRVEKRTKSFRALNDLDKLKLALYVQDAYWSAEYKALLGIDVFSEAAYQEYEGYFDATDQKFVFEKGVRFNPYYESVDLETPITFTPAQWISKMKKVEDYGWVDENGVAIIYTDVRPMGVWSNDTRQWYDISPAALKDPTLSAPVGEAPEFYDPFDASRGGITTETTEFISPADIPTDLVCLQDCLTPEKVQATFVYAYCGTPDGQNDLENCGGYVPSDSGSAPAPFADGGPFLAEDSTVVRIFEDENAANLLDTFYLSNPENELGREGFKLATGNAQVVDHVYVAANEAQGQAEAVTVENRVSIAKGGKDDGRLRLEVQDSLDEVNLNRLIAGEGGKAPIVTFDLQSAPAIGDSGTTTVELSIDRFAGETNKRLSATVPVDWEGTTSGFQLTVAAGAAVTLGYESDGTSVSASGVNPRKLVLGYTGGVATNRGRPGLTLKLLSLFNGDTWERVGLQSPSFFESDAGYNVSVSFGDGFTFAELGDDAEQAVSAIDLFFYTRSGSNAVFTERFEKGQWWDGIRASSVVRYKPNNSGFDVGGQPLSKGAVINQYIKSVEDPWNAFGTATYARPDGWVESLNYGLRTGQLVSETDLPKLECNNNNGVYEDHPAFTGDDESETRYCTQKLYETIGLTTYSVSLDLQPSYALLDASGEPVNIAAPRTMYYEVPDSEAFGRDGGKRLSLEFAGHGELRGVPGFVYDTATGEDKGEFVNEWQDSYRYLSRFTIPDGSTVTDLNGTTYFVKALDGEEWLKALDASESQPGEYTLTFSDLLADEALTVLGEAGSPDYIGEPPTCVDPDNVQTCALLNKGQPAVVHGELVVGADPTPLID